MRYRLSRIPPWPAAKVGVFVGLVHGLVVGLLLRALSSVAAPLAAYLGDEVQVIGWAAVVLVILLNGGFGGLAFAVAAALYNFVSTLGASFEVELEDDEEPPVGKPKQPDDGAGSGLSFDEKLFDPERE